MEKVVVLKREFGNVRWWVWNEGREAYEWNGHLLWLQEIGSREREKAELGKFPRRRWTTCCCRWMPSVMRRLAYATRFDNAARCSWGYHVFVGRDGDPVYEWNDTGGRAVPA